MVESGRKGALEFGVTFGGGGTSDIGGYAQRMEHLGLDYLATGEHISFRVAVANSFVTLSYAAAVTTRIKLLSAIVPLPLYPAVLAAKLAAALDHASNGRYVMGVGVGGEFPNEFEACGVPVEERGARCNEALEVLKRCWTEDSVDFHGRFNTLNDVRMVPKPVQQPHPAIWVSGRKQAAVRRAARYGQGWLPYFYTPEMLAESNKQLDEYCGEYGRDPDDVDRGVLLFATCHSDPAVARRFAADRLEKSYRKDDKQQSFPSLVERYGVVGTTNDCARRVEEYIEAGARKIIFGLRCPEEYRDQNAELLAEVAQGLRGSQPSASPMLPRPTRWEGSRNDI